MFPHQFLVAFAITTIPIEIQGFWLSRLQACVCVVKYRHARALFQLYVFVRR